MHGNTVFVLIFGILVFGIAAYNIFYELAHAPAIKNENYLKQKIIKLEKRIVDIEKYYNK